MINQYIRQYGKRLYGLCLTLCASAADADDIYQETWLKVVKKLRVTVILFYFRDMDLVSTAQAAGIPVGTVKSRLNKARRRLKEELANETDLQF